MQNSKYPISHWSLLIAFLVSVWFQKMKTIRKNHIFVRVYQNIPEGSNFNKRLLWLAKIIKCVTYLTYRLAWLACNSGFAYSELVGIQTYYLGKCHNILGQPGPARFLGSSPVLNVFVIFCKNAHLAIISNN